ncbi:MAG: flagellar basal body-associated FliL family protein [Reinekea forsetii]|nr:flagellar basal body-associated FliL family protein [Reinekea forsetii]
MADEDIPVPEGEAKGGGKLKLILMIVFGVLLIAILSVGGTWFLLKDKMSAAEPLATAANGMAIPAQMPIAALYHAMQPAFVINYTQNGKMRFLQVELSVLTRDPAVIALLALHNPLIRNNLLDVFSRQDVAQVGSAAGKQKLADELTASVQDIMKAEMDDPGIVSVLYRSFILQ